MTSLRKEKVKCAVCGKKSEIMALASTNQFGSPDLDLRPPEMARSSMFLWVYRCQYCGYCASRLDEGDASLLPVVESAAYRARLADSEVPRLAASFLCEAMIDETSGNLRDASWAFIHAAWACDDADNEVAARACRGKAADMVVRAEAQGQPICQRPEEGWAVLVDLLRRAGRVSEARGVIDAMSPDAPVGPARRVLDFQRELILRQDTRCHTLEEALPPAR